MEDGQKTPHGNPDFNSHVKILSVLVLITDRWTDRQKDRQRHYSSVGFPYYVPPGKYYHIGQGLRTG
jgi:hypothetical protein